MTYTYTDNELETLWDNLTMYEIATENELQLITDINGYNLEALEDVLYCRTWYRSRDQYEESEL